MKKAPSGAEYILRTIVKKYKEELLTFAIERNYAEIVINDDRYDLTDDDL